MIIRLVKPIRYNNNRYWIIKLNVINKIRKILMKSNNKKIIWKIIIISLKNLLS